MLDGAQQRPLDQVVAAEQVVGAERVALGLGEPDRQQLPRVVPLVGGLGDVDALVALQPDQRGAERGGQRLGGRGLADAGLALQQDRLAQSHRAEQRRRQPVVGEVAGPSEHLAERGDGRGRSRTGRPAGSRSTHRRTASGRSGPCSPTGSRADPGVHARQRGSTPGDPAGSPRTPAGSRGRRSRTGVPSWSRCRLVSTAATVIPQTGSIGRRRMPVAASACRRAIRGVAGERVVAVRSAVGRGRVHPGGHHLGQDRQRDLGGGPGADVQPGRAVHPAGRDPGQVGTSLRQLGQHPGAAAAAGDQPDVRARRRPAPRPGPRPRRGRARRRPPPARRRSSAGRPRVTR